ncbi:MAG TPA: hypothetical protein PKI59_03520 [Candidatus Cloacimonadota bacterium]|nr:hypothetical protein [Candidatus Cloacimonadota bacterium]
MKTTFKYGISAYSGTIDSITFGSYRKGTLCIARKYVVPRYTEYNQELGEIAKNLSLIYADVSAEYKADLKTYAYLYGQRITPKNQMPPRAYGLFVKMLYALADENVGTVDLKNITYNDIKTLFPEIVNIAAAVENGYLPKVEGTELLDEDM